MPTRILIPDADAEAEAGGLRAAGFWVTGNCSEIIAQSRQETRGQESVFPAVQYAPGRAKA